MISPYVELNWKLPKVEKGQEVRFLYFNSDMNDYRGCRGKIINVRYLSSNPLKDKDGDIKRGSVLYTIKNPSKKILSFYNQRMANMEIIK